MVYYRHVEGIDPKIWGPSAWHVLHRIAATDDATIDKHHFFASIRHILPCNMCRMNLEAHLKHLPIPTKNTNNAFPKWVWRLHNRVNQTNFPFSRIKNVDRCKEHLFLIALAMTHPGKRAITTTYLQALQTFMRVYLNLNNDNNPNWLRSRAEFQHLVKTLFSTSSTS
jgi:hypothetical protein